MVAAVLVGLSPTSPSLAASPQLGRPVSDIAPGGWSTAPLWDKLDEAAADDSTSEISSSNDPVVDAFEVLLSPLADPASSTGHIVRYRASASGSMAATVDAGLFQGTTLIASDVQRTLSPAYQTFSFTLSGAQADAITNYSDLRVQLVANSSGSGTTTNVLVTWIELEVPDVATATATLTATNTPTNTPTATTTPTSTPTPTTTPTPGVGPDLVVTTTDSPDPVGSGDTLTYTIRVRNIGTQPAATVGMIDQPPANFTYTGFSTTRGVCSLDGSVTGGLLDCDLGSFGTGPSAIATITVTGYVTTSVGTSVNDLATVDAAHVIAESNEANNTGAANTFVTASTSTITPPSPTATFTPTNTPTPGGSTPPTADLTVTKVASPNPVAGGSSVTFVIAVRNAGGQAASPVRVIDTPPANFVYTGFQPSAGSCTLIDSITGGELDCALGALAPGASATVLVHGYVPQQGTVTNSATVDPFDEVAEANESNNVASVNLVVTAPPTATPTLTSTATMTFTPTATFTATPVLPPGDLVISATDSADPINSGQTITYTVTITNVGISDVGDEIDSATNSPVGVHAFDQLPPQTADSAPSGTNFAITGFSVNFGGVCLYSSNARQLDCDFGIFHPNDVATITITGRLTSSANTTVTNRALVDLPTSHTQEAIEVTNNISQITTSIVGPTPTPTFTVTNTPTITKTPTTTNTPTVTVTPTPMPWPCADFNGDNRVLIQDILYVVNHYFTTDAAADLDGSGLVAVQDIQIAVVQYSITCP